MVRVLWNVNVGSVRSGPAHLTSADWRDIIREPPALADSRSCYKASERRTSQAEFAGSNPVSRSASRIYPRDFRPFRVNPGP